MESLLAYAIRSTTPTEAGRRGRGYQGESRRLHFSLQDHFLAGQPLEPDKKLDIYSSKLIQHAGKQFWGVRKKAVSRTLGRGRWHDGDVPEPPIPHPSPTSVAAIWIRSAVSLYEYIATASLITPEPHQQGNGEISGVCTSVRKSDPAVLCSCHHLLPPAAVVQMTPDSQTQLDSDGGVWQSVESKARRGQGCRVTCCRRDEMTTSSSRHSPASAASCSNAETSSGTQQSCILGSASTSSETGIMDACSGVRPSPQWWWWACKDTWGGVKGRGGVPQMDRGGGGEVVGGVP